MERAVSKIMEETIMPSKIEGNGHVDVHGLPFKAKNLAKALKKINPHCQIEFKPQGEIPLLLEE